MKTGNLWANLGEPLAERVRPTISRPKADWRALPRFRLYSVAVAIGLGGTATPFLPFTENVSPIATFYGDFASDFLNFGFFLLGSPFFLAVLVSIVSMRLWILGKSTKLERNAAYGISIVMAWSNLLFSLPALTSAAYGFVIDARDWNSMAMSMAACVLGAIALFRSWLFELPSELIAVTAMQTVYVMNAAVCLAAFWPGWQIGAFVTVLTVIAYVGQTLILLWPKDFAPT